MFPVVLSILAVFGVTVWVVLDRPVTASLSTIDRLSRLFLTLSAIAVSLGVAYGLTALR